jgi:glutaminyl-tRNA synthetase
MRKGEFKEGEKVLRAKIDMASQNMHLRDPALYRILHAHHHRTGDAWCIYPMYDYAHPLSDALESITHSLCTLEFEIHRPLYEWLINNVDGLPGAAVSARVRPPEPQLHRDEQAQAAPPRQRRPRQWLGRSAHAHHQRPAPPWHHRRRHSQLLQNDRPHQVQLPHRDRPAGARHPRGPQQNLPPRLRRAAPIKVVLTNYPEDQVEHFEAANHPEDPAAGTRQVPLCRELYIESDDFMEFPSEGFHRLKPGGEVRLKFAFCIICQEVIKDDAGNIIELRCTYDDATRHGKKPEGRTKPKGIIHWVSARHAIDAPVRLYDRLFTVETPDADAGEDGDFTQFLNPASLEVVENAKLEPSLKDAAPGTHWQFERVAYFYADPIDSKPGAPVFNRTVTLKEWQWETCNQAIQAPELQRRRLIFYETYLDDSRRFARCTHGPL